MNTENIRAKAQAFLMHDDLKSTPPTNRNVGVSKGEQVAFTQAAKTILTMEKEQLCRNWNNYNNCSCNKTNPDYKNIHKCLVCEYDTHPMRHCSWR